MRGEVDDVKVYTLVSNLLLFVQFHSIHSYIFFNKNRTSVTHVGLAIDNHENVVDQRTKKKLTHGSPTQNTISYLVKENVPRVQQER